jgi:NADH dehydrogenase [ubiquinone] 1 alpha subcomplex assembly factor 6
MKEYSFTCYCNYKWLSQTKSITGLQQEKNLVDPQYVGIEDLEGYSENTASSLLYLQLHALGVSDVKSDHLVSHIGKASGIITLLRGTPFHAQKRQFYLPSEIMAKVIFSI